MSQQVAKTILSQMGGASKLALMIGAKNFVSGDNSVSFRWKAKSKNKANAVRITLNGKDLYDVEFIRIHGVNVKTISEHNDIYADMLIELFETQTGLYLKFK